MARILIDGGVPMPVWLNTLFTAAISGVVTTLVAYAGMPHDLTVSRYLAGFAVGAAVGLVNWWRPAPHTLIPPR